MELDRSLRVASDYRTTVLFFWRIPRDYPQSFSSSCCRAGADGTSSAELKKEMLKLEEGNPGVRLPRAVLVLGCAALHPWHPPDMCAPKAEVGAVRRSV